MLFVKHPTRKIAYLLSFALIFLSHVAHAESIATATIKKIENNSATLVVRIPMEADDFVYKDFLDFSIDNPTLDLLAWHSSEEPENFYDPTFQETKKIFKKPVEFTLDVASQNPVFQEDFCLHVAYYTHSKKGIVEEVIPFSSAKEGDRQMLATAVDAQGAAVEDARVEKNVSASDTIASPGAKEVVGDRQQVDENNQTFAKEKPSWSVYIGSLVKTTESLWARLLLALLLGLLVSFTPCIYPMIPITIGILQAQQQASILSNFFISLAYVMGIALTFSCLGLL